MAKIHGAGPLADRLARLLTEMKIGPELAVWVAPEPRGDTPEAALQHLYLTPLRLVEALAARLPEAARDAEGEPVAGQQVLLLVDRALLVTGSGFPAHRAAAAALLAWVEEAALRLAPRLRLNVLALSLADPPDLRPALSWLTGRAVVTGQVLKLGPAPPSPAPFRSDTGENQP